MMFVYMDTTYLANIDPEGNVEWLTTVDWREWHQTFTGDVDYVLYGQDNPTRTQRDLWWHWRTRVENARMNRKEPTGMQTKTFRLTVTKDEFAMDTQGPEARLMQQVSEWILEQLRACNTSIDVILSQLVWGEAPVPYVEIQAELRGRFIVPGPYWAEPCEEAPVLTREALENARDAFQYTGAARATRQAVAAAILENAVNPQNFPGPNGQTYAIGVAGRYLDAGDGEIGNTGGRAVRVE